MFHFEAARVQLQFSLTEDVRVFSLEETLVFGRKLNWKMDSTLDSMDYVCPVNSKNFFPN
jgi:hypothetical protein